WPWLAPYARAVHWYNTGVAFGMFQDKNILFLVLALLVSLGIIIYFPRIPASEKALRIALSMQLGGALGNAIDRIQFGHVIDFISVGSFPVWNVADASITVGVFVLLLGIWLQERSAKKSAQGGQTASEEADDPR
ncbi:MAG: signal peptidase II, partial [Anaerolineaceae bacterium]